MEDWDRYRTRTPTSISASNSPHNTSRQKSALISVWSDFSHPIVGTLTSTTESDLKLMIMGIINARIPKSKINEEVYEIREEQAEQEDEEPKAVL